MYVSYLYDDKITTNIFSICKYYFFYDLFLIAANAILAKYDQLPQRIFLSILLTENITLFIKNKFLNKTPQKIHQNKKLFAVLSLS